MATPCYLIVPTGRGLLSLRRFGFGPSDARPRRHACPAAEPWPSGYRPGCDASSGYLDEIPYRARRNGVWPLLEDLSHRDRRWPRVCARCGEPFRHRELWQTNGEPIYRVKAIVPGAALSVGETTPLRDAPPGAIWEAKWARIWAVGFDGRSLICRLPDRHDWQIDGDASNCTRKGDRTHRCWLREGEPPFLTVGKHPDALTCSAGAGSIQSPGYHGFLREGILT